MFLLLLGVAWGEYGRMILSAMNVDQAAQAIQPGMSTR